MADRPHILILMPDQFRHDCLSCAGHPTIKTPNIDAIAGRGVLLSQATTVSPVCMPARASFVNGLYPHNHGMWGNSGQMPDDDETFFQILQRAGYRTAHIGKSHYYPHGPGHMRDHEGYMRARGIEDVHEVTGPLATQHMKSYMTDELEERGRYEEFKKDYAARGEARKENPFLVQPSPLPNEEFLDSYVGRTAFDYIQGYDDSRPMCLFVGFPGPHEPWDAPGEYASLYDPAACPPPIPRPEQNDSLPESIGNMTDFRAMPNSTPEAIAAVQGNYFGKISLIDDWVGNITDALKSKGMLDDTLVVFWSDHGEMLGDHRRVYKETFHESSMRVPMIVSWPKRFASGVTSDALCEIIDVFPTVLDACGVEPSKRAQGASLVPILEGALNLSPPSQLSEIHMAGERRFCIRTHKHKYAIRTKGIGYMLYDLENDPTEQNNLIGKDFQLEARMRELLFGRLVEAQWSM